MRLRVDRYALAEIASDRAVWDALLQISFSLDGIRSTDQLLERFLELIFKVIPAQHGAILIAGRNSNQFEFTTYRGGAFEVDRATASRVLGEREAIMDNRTNSSIYVPLRVFFKDFGVVCLQSEQAHAFTTTHFHLLIAAAVIGAISFGHTLLVERLENENLRLQKELDIQHGIVGDSPAMQAVNEFIGQVASSNSNVLILGESGTGKELVARAIHWSSTRSTGPFVAVNCAAIPETLAESELFGNEKGAFTGAAARRIGKIEAADKGTLFLDEVAELSMPMQAALLRFLQEREFHRVGGTRPIQVDVRVVAATNRNLQNRIKEGKLREDLYFRLNVVDIRMPSLSERRQDIPMLTDHFIQKYRHVRVVNGINPEARAALTRHDWPGNVRELQNTIERALVLGRSDFILPEDLPKELTKANAPEPAAANGFRAQDQQHRRTSIEEALQETEGNVAAAARRLGISTSYLHRLIRKLKI